MGAWGTAIFSDDFACDIQDDYIKALVKGKTSEEATEMLKKLYPPEELIEDTTIFWVALAITQWKKGRLLPEVKSEAIKMIESGADLLRWEGGPKAFYNKRKAVLEKAKEKILSPMPPAKKISMPSWMKDDPWQLGDAVSYKILREDIEFPEYIGKYVVLKIVERRVMQEDGPKRNYYAVYNWHGDKIPEDLTEVKRGGYLKLKENENDYFNREYISIEKCDVRNHDMKLLESNSEYDIRTDELIKKGLRFGGLRGPEAFDFDIARVLSRLGL